MSDAWTGFPSGSYGPQRPYVYEIYSATFKQGDPTDQNNPDTPRIVFTGRSDDPDFEEWELALRLERKQPPEVINDGAEIRYANPKKKLPNANTQYGKFAASIDKNKGPDNNLAELMKVIASRGAPTEAKVWEGLRIVVGEEPGTFTDDEGEKREFFSSVIVDYEGQVDEESLSAANAGREEKLANQREQLAKIAAGSSDHAEFANRALSEVDDLDDSDLLQEVMDAGSDGFYEQNKE